MALHAFGGVAWCYFIMKKHKWMVRLLLLLEDRVCLFWFVAPFTWPNILICWCRLSCFGCVTTSVTSSGYCETLVKTAFIKPLPNKETETLLLISSCSPVRLWNTSPESSSLAWTHHEPPWSEGAFTTWVGFESVSWEQFWHLNLAGRQHGFSLCASYSCV